MIPKAQLASEPVPLIVVEGFLGGAGAVLWGDFEQHLNCSSSPTGKRRVIFTSVGPVSSLHDRACELYYALQSGTVDYGEDHSIIHGHSRYGRTNPKGLYPQWSRVHPLHFLGHSIGGPTIVKLQFLLKQGHFGPHGHPDMILSVNTVSAPFRGTQLVYTLGERVDAAPAVRPFSVGSALAKWIHLVTFLSPFLPRILDLHAEARSLSYREISFLSLFRQLRKSDWAEGRDATPFDVTFEAADERESNLEGQVHPHTFYRSETAHMKSNLSTNLWTSPFHTFISSPLYLTSRAMISFDFSWLQPMPSFLAGHVHGSHIHSLPTDTEQGIVSNGPPTELGDEYRENDGIVPLFSQWHPLPCRLTRCRHSSSESIEYTNLSLDRKRTKPEPGIWYVNQLEEATHISIVPFWSGSLRQKYFWEDMGRWLRDIDEVLSNSERHGNMERCFI